MKDLYTENYKTLLKEIKENLSKWKVTCVHELEDLILLRWPHYPKRSIDAMQSLIKIPAPFFFQ